MTYLLLLIFTFLGYIVGRTGHVIGNHLKTRGLHHWVTGLLIAVAGFIFRDQLLRLGVISLGVGLFISDLKDFINLEVWGIDHVEKIKFWGID